MNRQALLDRLGKLPSYTASERTLARYFEREYLSLSTETIESLSEKTGVSKASISRFVTRLGYPNFRAFLHAQWQEGQVETPIRRYARRAKKATPAEALLDEHLTVVANNLVRTREKIRPEAFAEALDLLCDEERHLFVLGSAASAHLLGYFSVLLRYMRGNVTLLGGDGSAVAHDVARMEPSAVLFAMTTMRYANRTTALLRHFFERGHPTILVTDSYAAPCIAWATVPLVMHAEGPNMFNTRCSALAILEALIAGMSTRLETTVPERYEAIDELLRLMDVYPAK